MDRSLASSQQMASVEQWLNRHGFVANPFADREADRETRLSEYFVETPYYDDILGTPTNPRSMVVYAGRGCGKSAHRLMVARACRPHSQTSSILAVEYTSFGRLAEMMTAGFGGSLLRQHLDRLMERTVEALITAILTDPVLADQMPIENIGRLKAFWEAFGTSVEDPAHFYALLRTHHPDTFDLDWQAFLAGWRDRQLKAVLEASQLWQSASPRFLAHLVDSPPAELDLARYAPAEIYEKLVGLVRTAGLEAVYVLVDRADEPHALADQPDLVADMLAPLIGELPLMECPGAAFKFFLPTEVACILADRPGIRLDRVLFRELRWEEETLRELLSARLSAFSQGKIAALGQMSEPDLGNEIDSAIVQQALGVPRNLLRLAEELVLAHCQRAGDALLLTHADWQKALAHYHGTAAIAGLRTPTCPPLRLQRQTRTASIGGRTIRLSDTHFNLLWYLAQRPGQVVKSHVLWDVAGSHDALRTAVRRIRKKIEPDSKKPIYLITVRGEGMRLDNVLPAVNAEETR